MPIEDAVTFRFEQRQHVRQRQCALDWPRVARLLTEPHPEPVPALPLRRVTAVPSGRTRAAVNDQPVLVEHDWRQTGFYRHRPSTSRVSGNRTDTSGRDTAKEVSSSNAHDGS